MPKIVFKEVITQAIVGTACDYLAERTGLSKSRIKKAMNCGAVWLKRFRKKERRLRRATAKLQQGDQISIFYDEKILSEQAPPARLVVDKTDYSAWFKPAGMLTQGSRFGDHCSLEYFVTHHFQPVRKVFIVHRLDREARGLVLLAHHRKAAARLSALWQRKEVRKYYQIRVRGDLQKADYPGRIDSPIEGRDAVTLFDRLRYDDRDDTTLVRVELVTGRRHQIRRHFESIGFPVLGDPIYGKGNKNQKGLQLIADGLVFICPFAGDKQKIHIDAQREMRWDQE